MPTPEQIREAFWRCVMDKTSNFDKFMADTRVIELALIELEQLRAYRDESVAKRYWQGSPTVK
jgi:hypothetical protein